MSSRRGSHLSVALGIRRREKGVENDDRLVQIPDEHTVDFILAVFFPLLRFLAATPSMKYWDPPRKSSLPVCIINCIFYLSHCFLRRLLQLIRYLTSRRSCQCGLSTAHVVVIVIVWIVSLGSVILSSIFRLTISLDRRLLTWSLSSRRVLSWLGVVVIIARCT